MPAIVAESVSSEDEVPDEAEEPAGENRIGGQGAMGLRARRAQSRQAQESQAREDTEQMMIHERV